MAQSRLLPKPPQTQALSSETFKPPLLDGTLSLPEIYDWHMEKCPRHPLFVFAPSNRSPRTIFWPEAVRAMHTGAKLVRKMMGWEPGLMDPPVVAILASEDTITYFTMTVAVMRAGYIVFPISPRNSAAAVAHLIDAVKVKCVLLGHEESLNALVNEAMEILDVQYKVYKPDLVPIPLFDDLFLNDIGDSTTPMSSIPYERRGQDDIAMYLHSSGSTAFPKPISWTNYRLIQLALIPFFGERDLTGVVLSLHVMPMYHGMGALQLCWTASCGLVVSAFEPKSPPIMPTAQNHFEAAVACNSDIIFCVPSIIEEWSRKPKYVEWLATRHGVLFGGGPLNKAVGDYLASKGVSMFILYGSTEAGIMSPLLPTSVGHDWEFFRFPENIKPEMVAQGDGTYELVIVSNPFCEPSVLNTQIEGVKAYATSDLFIEHPERPGYWRVYGRADDQIMHSTGEKTNPGPLENMLNQDPHVQASVMFGRGQFQAGVIMDPKEDFKFDPADERKLAEFRNAIWPTVRRMNAFAPQHSRLFKEMIMICKPSKPFQYTAKNTPRRQAIINNYAEEIKALYDAVADSAQLDIPLPKIWETEATLEFTREVVSRVLERRIEDTADIFQHGCDSLQATWIRNTLLRSLRDHGEVDTRNLVENFVYDYPTVSDMASFLTRVAKGCSASPAAGAILESKAVAMRAMVNKYTQNLPSRPCRPSDGGDEYESSDSEEVVLLTGTTGALGCYVLAELVQNPNVLRVYAVNRVSVNDASGGLPERQKRALIRRGLDADVILESGKVVLMEADISLPNLGLEDDVYEEVKKSTTRIIHNAWPVDFNLALSSFERSIKGLRNLIDLSLTSPRTSPPTIVYTSSIGVFQNVDSTIQDFPLPESPIAAEVAIGTGYTESKWVSEEILIESTRRAALNTIIVRVGQLTGGLNGCWNTSEWLPSIIQSSQVLGCLPTDDRLVDWIPLGMAARALVDFRKPITLGTSSFVHLIHPKPVPWSSLAHSVSKSLSLSLSSFSEWVGKLEELHRQRDGGVDSQLVSPKSRREVAGLRLLPFLRSLETKAHKSLNAFGFARLCCDNAVLLSPTLASREQAPPLDAKDVELWLKYWQSDGFLKTEASQYL